MVAPSGEGAERCMKQAMATVAVSYTHLVDHVLHHKRLIGCVLNQYLHRLQDLYGHLRLDPSEQIGRAHV